MFITKLCRFVSLLIFIIFIYSYNLTASSIVIGCCQQKVTIWRYWETVDGTLKERMLIFNGDSTSVNISVSVSKYIEHSTTSLLVDDSTFGIIGGPWYIQPYESMIVDDLNFSISDSSRIYFKITGIKKDSAMVLGYIQPYNYKPRTTEYKSALYSTPFIGREQDHFWWELESFLIKSGSSSVIKLNIVENTATKLLYGHHLEGISLIQMEDSLLRPGVSGWLMPQIHKIEAPGFNEHYTYAKDSLDYWGRGLKYILNYSLLPSDKNSDDEEKVFTINFHITAAPVNKPQVEWLEVIVNRGRNKQGYLLRLIITP
jgi:hypothetical protein